MSTASLRPSPQEFAQTHAWLCEQQVEAGLSALLASLQSRDARNSGASCRAVAAWFRAMCTAPGAQMLTAAAMKQHVRVIWSLLRATAGGEFAAQNVAPRLLRIIDEESGKRAGAGSGNSGVSDTSAVGARTDTPADAETAALCAINEVRESCAVALASLAHPSSKAVTATSLSTLTFASVREGVVDALDELLDDLELSVTTVSASAPDVFAHGDVVLVAGCDAGVREIILGAAKRRRLGEVIICEASAGSAVAPPAGATPVLPGHALALELTSRAKPLSVTLIPDATAGAVMHRVNKVLVAARAIAADGSVLADAPALLLTLAAAGAAGAPRVPVICIANALSFLPREVAASEAGLTQLAILHGGCDPAGVLPTRAAAAAEALYAAAVVDRPFRSDGDGGGGGNDDDFDGEDGGLTISAFDLDVLPASAVTLFLTNAGPVAPAQAARVLEELYGP